MPAANPQVPINPDGTGANTFIGNVGNTGVVFSNGGRLENSGGRLVSGALRVQLPSAGELEVAEEAGHSVTNDDATFITVQNPAY
jgi:hypothetical protein